MNASKYSPSGSGIRIELELLEHDPTFLQVSVHDQGFGINETDRANLFRPFFRSRTAVRASATGVGFGLFIARSLTELHGGTISLDSSPGHGSTFRITLPVDAEPLTAC